MINWSVALKSKGKKNSKTSGNDSSSNLDSEGNILYFYSGVDDDSIFDFNKKIVEKDKELTILGFQNDITPPPIKIRIHSYGGSVFAAFAAMNYIETRNVQTHTYIDGAAASAATLMSVCGNERYICEHGYMLIHQLSSWSIGNYEQLKDDMFNNDTLMKKIYKVYEKYTKIPKTKIKELLKKDIWWDAQTCLKYGLVDDIISVDK